MSQYKRPGQQGRPAPSRRPVAPTRRARQNGRLPADFLTLVIVGAVIIALGVTAQILWPNAFSLEPSGGAVQASSSVSEIHSAGPVRINELMSSNSSTAVDDHGESSDWIEVMNVTDSDVNLSGYMLGKDENAVNVFTFPEQILPAGECVLVYADSTLAQDAGAAYHAPFRLSSQGGSLMLFSPTGSAVDSVNFPALSSDTSYARQDQSSWAVSGQPTPGLSNTQESYQALHTARAGAGVEITEIVSSNTQYAPDENGVCQDYFELHNATGAAIDLGGWFVSDTVGRPAKWRLPEGFVIQAGEYRIVYASGLDRADPSYPHAGFGLSSEGEAVVLADGQGRVVDEVEFGLLKADQAYLKSADGAWTTGTPSPNAPNS